METLVRQRIYKRFLGSTITKSTLMLVKREAGKVLRDLGLNETHMPDISLSGNQIYVNGKGVF